MSRSRNPGKSRGESGAMTVHATNDTYRRLYGSHFLSVILLIVVTAVVYYCTVDFDFILNWDDDKYILHNPMIQELSWANFRQMVGSFYFGNYAPLHLFAYAVDYALWKNNPFGYHLANLIVHATCGVLWYVLLYRLYQRREIAFIAALLFLVHPVQVESVAWVSERKNLLSMSFFLLSWHCYLDGEEHKSRYVMSLVFFACALASKSIAVILPLVLLLADLTLHGKRLSWRVVARTLPFVLLAFLLSVLTVRAQAGSNAPYHGGSPYVTLLTMLTVLVDYLRMVVWPFGLSVVYAPPLMYSFFSFPVLAATALLAALFVATAWLWSKGKRDLAFWILLSAVAILPVSQIVPLLTMMNDRYLYFPMLGFSALAALAISKGLNCRERWIRHSSALAALLVVSALAWGAHERSRVWQDAAHLWRDAVLKQPNSRSSHQGMAWVYKGQGNYQAAAREYELAVQLAPESDYLRNELGKVYAEMGEYEKARDSFRHAVRLNSGDSAYLSNLGIASMQAGDYRDAIAIFQQGWNILPDRVKTACLLSALYEKTGDRMRSSEYYRRGAKLDPAKTESFCAEIRSILK